MSFTATVTEGRVIAIVMSKAPNRGMARIKLDGVSQGRIDTYSDTKANRVIVVVWIDGRNRSRDIYGHAVTGEGRRVGSDRRISYGWNDDDWPAIAHNAVDDEYMVVWRDSRDGWTRATDIYGQLVATN